MALFKKELPGFSLASKGMPTDRVREMSSKGFSEPEMIDVLRKEGYSAEDIDKSMTQVLKAGLTSEYPPTSLQQSAQSQLPALEQLQQQMPQMPETSLPESYYYPEQQQYPTQEYVDIAVREKMNDVDQKISEFGIRYEEMNGKMNNLYDQMNTMLQTRTGEQQQILSKIDSFTSTVNDVEARLSSLDKAFKEVLPALIESVRSLSDLVQRLKKEG